MSDGVRGWIERHPFWFAFWVLCLALGPIVGWFYLHEVYGVALALIAGLIGGAGTALIMSIARLIGDVD